MKILVMCQGTSLDSPIARGIERAECYLLVDPTTLITEVCPTVHAERQATLLAQAAAHGVSTVLSGSDESASKVVFTPSVMIVFFRDAITVREAIRRWRSGEIFDGEAAAPTSPRAESPFRGWYRRLAFARRSTDVVRKGWTGRATPQGRHHIQQYAGRGH